MTITKVYQSQIDFFLVQEVVMVQLKHFMVIFFQMLIFVKII